MQRDQQYGEELFAHGRRGEAARLAALAGALDDSTFRWLGRLPILPHWRCLDVGTGIGTVATWLSQRCPSGRVVATDRDSALLPSASERDWEALEHDVTTDDFPDGSFDLINVRWVLSHLRDREAVLARIVRWLAPGGWVLVQDLDRFPIASSPDPVYRKVSAAMCDAVEARIGTDTSWARTFPAPLRRAGLIDLDTDAFAAPTGATAMGRFWLGSAEQLRGDLLEQFAVTEPELKHLREQMDNPNFRDFALASVAAWGRRPGPDA